MIRTGFGNGKQAKKKNVPQQTTCNWAWGVGKPSYVARHSIGARATLKPLKRFSLVVSASKLLCKEHIFIMQLTMIRQTTSPKQTSSSITDMDSILGVFWEKPKENLSTFTGLQHSGVVYF